MGTRPDRCDTGREPLIRTGRAQTGRFQQIPGSREVVLWLGAAAAWFNYCHFFFFDKRVQVPDFQAEATNTLPRK